MYYHFSKIIIYHDDLPKMLYINMTFNKWVKTDHLRHTLTLYSDLYVDDFLPRESADKGAQCKTRSENWPNVLDCFHEARWRLSIGGNGQFPTFVASPSSVVGKCDYH